MSEIDPVIEPGGEEQSVPAAAAEPGLAPRHPEASQTAKDLGHEDASSQPRPFAVSAAQGDATGDVPPPLPPRRKSRAGVFFLGAFSGCLIVFLGFVFLVVLFAVASND